MEKKSYITKSRLQTQKLGREFVHHLFPGDSVLLTGELGAGKTTFVQGVASALLIKSRITSPTFVIVRKHSITGKKNPIRSFYHVDLFRIDSAYEIENLGLDDVFEDPNGVVFIEWGKKASKARFNWEIDFKIESNKSRKITITKIKKDE